MARKSERCKRTLREVISEYLPRYKAEEDFCERASSEENAGQEGKLMAEKVVLKVLPRLRRLGHGAASRPGRRK